ncbi:MAG: hypothetical protein H7A33_01950 [Deltaproteobacteria bacterium]|nr:hypothetical protein [Deltaproteobacteria bacterium]
MSIEFAKPVLSSSAVTSAVPPAVETNALAVPLIDAPRTSQKNTPAVPKELTRAQPNLAALRAASVHIVSPFWKDPSGQSFLSQMDQANREAKQLARIWQAQQSGLIASLQVFLNTPKIQGALSESLPLVLLAPVIPVVPSVALFYIFPVMALLFGAENLAPFAVAGLLVAACLYSLCFVITMGAAIGTGFAKGTRVREQGAQQVHGHGVEDHALSLSNPQSLGHQMRSVAARQVQLAKYVDPLALAREIKRDPEIMIMHLDILIQYARIKLSSYQEEAESIYVSIEQRDGFIARQRKWRRAQGYLDGSEFAGKELQRRNSIAQLIESSWPKELPSLIEELLQLRHTLQQVESELSHGFEMMKANGRQTDEEITERLILNFYRSAFRKYQSIIDRMDSLYVFYQIDWVGPAEEAR